MDTVKQWAIIVVISAIIVSVFDMLSPDGRMKRTFKIVLGVFFMCAVTVPFVNLITNAPVTLDKLQNESIPTELKGDVANEFSRQASSQIERLAGDLLDENNIEYKKINANMDIDEDLSISIIRIKVTIDKSRPADIDIIKNILEENLNIQTEVEAL